MEEVEFIWNAYVFLSYFLHSSERKVGKEMKRKAAMDASHYSADAFFSTSSKSPICWLPLFQVGPFLPKCRLRVLLEATAQRSVAATDFPPDSERFFSGLRATDYLYD